jgi:ABC-2 type transport system ATP-binding protein
VVAQLRQPASGLASVPGVHSVQEQGNHVTCEVDADAMDAVLATLASSGVVSLVSQPPTLEQLFLQHYSEGAVA